MDHLRHQKYKNKQLKNSTLELENKFKPINIPINYMDNFEDKRREHLLKTLCMIGKIG